MLRTVLRRAGTAGVTLMVVAVVVLCVVAAAHAAERRGALAAAGSGAPAAGVGAAAAATATATDTDGPTATAVPTQDPTADPDGVAAPSPSPGPVVATPQTYRVVAFGDSVPAGTACGCESYVHLVASDAAARHDASAQVTDLSVAGQTTAGVLAQLDDPQVVAALADADLVIVTVGANDLDPSVVTDADCAAPALSCYQDDLATQATGLDQLFAEVAGDTRGDAEVLATGYWNVFLDGRVAAGLGSAYRTTSDALTRVVNAAVAAAATANGATYVDIYTPFKGDGSLDDTRLLAPDGDHPSAAGHQVIAEALDAAL